MNKFDTRQEIIDKWLKHPLEFLDGSVCPNCSGLLFCDSGVYYCVNLHCALYEITLHADELIVEETAK